ncbi:hypothetical protein AB6O49_23840 [Streptomyces sp. SBR177]
MLRFYHPDLVTPEPLAAARRLLDQWRGQSDPSLLASARDLAETALGAEGPPARPEEAAGARLVLGQVLHAQAGTAAARDRGQRRDLLDRALAELVRAGELAPAGGPDWAEARLEQAAVQYALWRHTGDTARLDAALGALAGDPADWPESHRHALRVRRGRLHLARAEGAEAAAEFTAALALRATGPVLLDLADALHLAAAPHARVADALDRAEPLLGDSLALRLRWTTALARLHETTGDGPAADEAYERATLLTPPRASSAAGCCSPGASRCCAGPPPAPAPGPSTAPSPCCARPSPVCPPPPACAAGPSSSSAASSPCATTARASCPTSSKAATCSTRPPAPPRTRRPARRCASSSAGSASS